MVRTRARCGTCGRPSSHVSATSTASDSKRFASWDSNLMTEFHARYSGCGVMIYWHVDKGGCISIRS
ncbi:Tn3 family transposase [Actinomadura coerulea]|uniref:Tn3 family transposase n=1 Tax=Actinomadura coerulea TaxID=46159 RepID=UPI00343C815F